VINLCNFMPHVIYFYAKSSNITYKMLLLFALLFEAVNGFSAVTLCNLIILLESLCWVYITVATSLMSAVGCG